MPIYEYGCGSCGKSFEEFQSIKSEAPKSCKLCGSGPVRRIISRTSFILKGTGWYVTDYTRKPSGSGNNGRKKSKERKEDKGEEKKSQGSSEIGNSA